MRLAILFAALLCIANAGTLRADDDSVLFSDDFKTQDSAWGNPDDKHHAENGKFVFKAAVNTNYTSLYQGNLFGDADVTVKVTETDGGTDEAAGITFWASDYNNFYVAEVQPDGTAGVLRMVQSQWIAPVHFVARESAVKGVGKTNELRVVTQGNLATIYLNGKQIAAFHGSPPDGGQQIGLHAESGNNGVYTWEFSDLVVRKPPAASASAGSTQPANDGSILYAADFSTYEPTWGTPDPQDYVENGKFVQKPDPNTYDTDLYCGGLFGDADIRIKITATAGSLNEPAGLAFWASDAHTYYVAQIQPDGNFAITRRLQNKWLYPVDFSVKDAVKKGLNQTNELRLVLKGRSCTAYVNDQQVATFNGFPPSGMSQIGLHAESGNDASTWQFSDLVVRKLQ